MTPNESEYDTGFFNDKGETDVLLNCVAVTPQLKTFYYLACHIPQQVFSHMTTILLKATLT
jgi:hypothetical protein